MLRRIGVPVGSYEDVIKCEDKLVKAFDYELMVLTVLNFVESLSAMGIVFDSDTLR